MEHGGGETAIARVSKSLAQIGCTLAAAGVATMAEASRPRTFEPGLGFFVSVSIVETLHNALSR